MQDKTFDGSHRSRFLDTIVEHVGSGLYQRWNRAANRLAKWRTVFASWQLGTRLRDDPESQAVRDQRELLLMLRCEVNALVELCAQKGIFDQQAWMTQLVTEYEALERSLEQKFPGFKASDEGMVVDVEIAHETTKNWRP